MTTFTLFMMAVGLSMDACAVTISNGIVYKQKSKFSLLLAPVLFGLFQALMPLVGFALGRTFAGVISGFDHWIAFGLLLYIGADMVKGSITEKDADVATQIVLAPSRVLVQAVATSIDALAVGVSLALLDVSIFSACLFIGLVTFGICLLALPLGKLCGCILKSKAQLFGGVILIAIGAKILLEHTLF